MARIATGSFDAVIISHKSLESLPVSDETFKRFLSKEIASLDGCVDGLVPPHVVQRLKEKFAK